MTNGLGSRTCCPAGLDKLERGPRTMACIVDEVLYCYRVEIPWRELPEHFGYFLVEHLRRIRWGRCGVWLRVFEALALTP